MSGNKLIYLASFPKSGNTWLRFLLANCLHDGDVNFDNINKIMPTSLDELQNHEAIEFVKEHRTLNNIKAEKDSRAILIIRDPFDCLLSFYKFINQQYPGMFKNHREFARNYHVFYNTWGKNVKSWLQHSNLKIIKYEDLKLQPEIILPELLAFCNMQVCDEKFKSAIGKSSIDNMRKLPNQSKFMSAAKKNAQFVNSGEVGVGIDQFSDDVRDIILSCDDTRQYYGCYYDVDIEQCANSRIYSSYIDSLSNAAFHLRRSKYRVVKKINKWLHY